ncbi:hypothetical protein L6Q21_12385 [Sandaracinobacter sp. RS1-74]|uniref:hypothetical protein n=1 Tax=Sandaracinobacteroides sayramensis TaxID=2913411 RepID=UPI001EDAFFBD|nr:hypothetical protein [Sandaracinobacteroides sayramensis]MCG2841781.1 hypothetical protein [Sandaracinobacteroides sayramensis]
MELRFLLPLGALLLSACGYKSAVTRLEPPDPALTKDEQKAARAAERRQVEAGLQVPAAARPQRVDDLTVKLEQRRDDPFSLPPEGTAGGTPIPFPGDPLPKPDARPAEIAPER